MSMEIRNNYSSYGTSYATKNAKQASEGKQTDTGNKTAGETTVKDKVADYYSNLQKKYECVRNGSVAISGSYLRACANDPEKAKELEENLAFFKEGYERGYQNAKAHLQSLGDTLTSYSESWSIDKNGNITMMSMVSGTANAGTKDAEELRKEQEQRLKVKKEKARIAEKKEKERVEEKKKAEKAEQKKAEEKLRGEQMEKTATSPSIEKFDTLYRQGMDVSV